MPANIGGNPLPVTTGGSGPTEARAAVPVYVVTSPGPVGGAARRVVVVTSGPVEGGPAIPVYNVGAGGPISAEPALPVYVVQGSLGGSSPAVIDPATIAGVKAWWKASSIGQGDSTAITTWTDSLNSIAPTQATAGAKPTYRTAQAPNSRPAVSFDGGDVLSVGVLGSNLFSSNQAHIFLVMKQTGTDAQNCPLCWFSGGTDTVEALLSYDDVLYFDWSATGATGRVNVAQPVGWDDAWHLVQLIRNPPNSGTSAIRVDASQVVSGAISATINTALTSPLNIGAQQAGGGINITGFIADILIYNVALSTTDRQSVEAYFNSLYNLF